MGYSPRTSVSTVSPIPTNEVSYNSNGRVSSKLTNTNQGHTSLSQQNVQNRLQQQKQHTRAQGFANLNSHRAIPQGVHSQQPVKQTSPLPPRTVSGSFIQQHQQRHSTSAEKSSTNQHFNLQKQTAVTRFPSRGPIRTQPTVFSAHTRQQSSAEKSQSQQSTSSSSSSFSSSFGGSSVPSPTILGGGITSRPHNGYALQGNRQESSGRNINQDRTTPYRLATAQPHHDITDSPFSIPGYQPPSELSNIQQIKFPTSVTPVSSQHPPFQTGYDNDNSKQSGGPGSNLPSLFNNLGNAAAQFSSSTKSSQSSSSSQKSSSSSSSSSSINYLGLGSSVSQTRLNPNIRQSSNQQHGRFIAPSKATNRKKEARSAPIPSYLASLSNTVLPLKIHDQLTSGSAATRFELPLVRQSRNLQKPPLKTLDSFSLLNVPSAKSHRRPDKSLFKPPTKMEYFDTPPFRPNDWIPMVKIVPTVTRGDDRDGLRQKRLSKASEFNQEESVPLSKFTLTNVVFQQSPKTPTVSEDQFLEATEFVAVPAKFVENLEKEGRDLELVRPVIVNSKNSGFGKFHTRKANQKTSDDGSNFRFNTHFYSQA